ncbi:DUF2339 domain-containing protein [bacterium]|nr:DUF2339 domain-containing protein [bacterium]
MDKHDERSLSDRIEQLESVVEELRKTLTQVNETLARNERIGETMAHEKYSAPVFLERTREAAQSQTALPREQKAIVSGIREATPHKPVKPSRPSRTREEWEALIGGKLLNRIGALALIIGIGFFLKYAFDNNWINETMRVIVGAVAGTALLYGGSRFHRKGLSIFAQGLIGAGIPILYLSVYASFNFYHLVPQTVAFVLMSVVTITAFQQAIRYDSFAVSLLGWFGGFLTPFLLSTGVVNEVGLFTYIVLLDIGLIAVQMKKTTWAILELLTLGATYITYGLWYGNYYKVDNFPVAILFTTLFWGLFYVLDISGIIKPVTSFPRLRQTVSALNAVFYYWALYAVINPDHHAWMAPVTLLIGVVYFLTLQWSQRRHVVDEGIRNRYALTAGALLIIATGIRLSGFLRVTVWSIEGLALVWYGCSGNLRYVWRAAIGLFVLATISLFVTQFPDSVARYKPVEGIRFLFNIRALAFAVLAASIGFSVLPLRRLKEDFLTKVRQALHYWWSIILFVLCTVETYDLFAGQAVYRILLMIALGWAVYSFIMVWPALRMDVRPVLRCGWGSLLLAVAFAVTLGLMTFVPIEDFRFALNVRTGVLAVLIAGVYLQTRWVKTIMPDYRWRKETGMYLRIALVLLVFALITGETKDSFTRSIVFAKQSGVAVLQGEITRLQNLKQLSLSGVWLIYSILLMGAGMWRRIQKVRMVAIVLFGITILKIFIYDLSFLDSLYRIFSFIGLGIILLAVSYVYQRYKAVIFESFSGE